MTTKLSSLLGSTEARVVFAVLMLIALVDLCLRVVDNRLSDNVAHIEAIPELVAETGRPAGRSLLLLGNSLTNNGVSPQVVTAELPSIALAKVTPDASGLWSWQCLLDHQVIERSDVQYDAVVIGFAWHLLSDQTRANASRLGGLYCDWSDLGRAGEIGLRDSGDIGEFIAAKVLRTYALRETLRNSFFQRSVPNYVEFTQANNASFSSVTERATAEPAREVKYTYRTLTALADRLKAEGTRVIVVAIPVQQDYSIDPQLRELARRDIIEMIDLRKAEGIQAAHYLDGIHLNSTGQQILSRALAEDLAAELFSAT